MSAEIKAAAQKHGQAAIDRLVALMNSDDERVSVAACREILDRAYGKPTQGVEVGGELAITKIETVIVDPKHRDG